MEDFFYSPLLSRIANAEEAPKLLRSWQDFRRHILCFESSSSPDSRLWLSRILHALLNKAELFGNPDNELQELITETIRLCQENDFITATEISELPAQCSKTLKHMASLKEAGRELNDYFRQMQRHPSSGRIGLSLCDFKGNLSKLKKKKKAQMQMQMLNISSIKSWPTIFSVNSWKLNSRILIASTFSIR